MAKLDADSLKQVRGYKSPFTVIAEALKLFAQQTTLIEQGKFRMLLRTGTAFSESMTAEAVQAGAVKGFGGAKFTLNDYITGLRELKLVFQDKDLLNSIVKRAYDQHIKPVLITRLGNTSLHRKGHGDLFRKVGLEEVGKSRKARDLKSSFFTRSGEELGTKWKQVYDLISTPGKIVGPGVVEGFNLEKVLAIKMASKNSEFTSVYMMAEFGTGRVADPGPRRYQSRKTTPYKISPTLAAFGGDTSWWFSIPRSILYADKIEKASKKISRIAKKSKRKRDLSVLNTNHLFDFAMGAPGSRSIKPRHVIFDARGIVKQLQTAYHKAYEAIAKDLNDQLVAKVNIWPKDGIKFNFTPAMFQLDFPKIVK